MAGLNGKTGWVAVAKQTAKGAAATAPTYRNPFAGGNIAPVRETDRLAETDSSRDQGAAYVTTSGVEGSPEVYVRDDSIVAYLAACLGNIATSGVAPNFIHTVTPGNLLAYHTFWRNVGGASGITEQFLDCFVSGLTISAEAGNPLTAAVNIQGLAASRLTVDPTPLPALAAGVVYNFNDAAVSLGGASTRLISSFDLSIENNVSRQQTDDVVPYDLSAGQREITLGFDMIFEDLDEYNKFHYGGAAGTQISPNIYTTSATFVFSKGTNNEITFALPSIAYEEYPIEPDPGGDPIVVPVRAVAQKDTGVTDLLTATIKNQVASYA